MIAPTVTSLRRRFAPRLLVWLPLVAAIIAIVLANAGVRLTPDARAASSSVTVTATVTAIASTATNGCSSAIAISVTQGALPTTNFGTCTITFGSSNSSGVTLTAVDSTPGDAFFTAQSGNFANAGSSCAAMTTTDQVGYKVISTGLTATQNKCAASTTAQNTNYSPVPAVAETICTTNASGSQDCPVAVGMNENGSNAPAGSYTGTINFASS